MITVVVANLKGGTGKTTSAGYLAHVFHERGLRVLVVDADPQGSALRWQEDADWPIPVVRLDSAKLHRNLPGITGDDRYDVVVIDTPPGDLPIVASALRLATHVVVPMAPTSADFERLAAVRELLAEVAPLRADGDEPAAWVLLTKTVANAAATGVYRELTEDAGVRVLRTRVGNLQRFAQATGAPISRASASAYGDVADELLAEAGR
jgi:chromosome partitioning protein